MSCGFELEEQLQVRRDRAHDRDLVIALGAPEDLERYVAAIECLRVSGCRDVHAIAPGSSAAVDQSLGRTWTTRSRAHPAPAITGAQRKVPRSREPLSARDGGRAEVQVVRAVPAFTVRGRAGQ